MKWSATIIVMDRTQKAMWVDPQNRVFMKSEIYVDVKKRAYILYMAGNISNDFYQKKWE